MSMSNCTVVPLMTIACREFTSSLFTLHSSWAA